MARLKQNTPVRREVSSEYISKYDRSSGEGVANTKEEANGRPIPSKGPGKAESVVIQLIIAVGGIYGSL